MPTAFEAIDRWIDEARTKLENGGLQKGDLDQLCQIISYPVWEYGKGWDWFGSDS